MWMYCGSACVCIMLVWAVVKQVHHSYCQESVHHKILDQQVIFLGVDASKSVQYFHAIGCPAW